MESRTNRGRAAPSRARGGRGGGAPRNHRGRATGPDNPNQPRPFYRPPRPFHGPPQTLPPTHASVQERRDYPSQPWNYGRGQNFGEGSSQGSPLSGPMYADIARGAQRGGRGRTQYVPVRNSDTSPKTDLLEPRFKDMAVSQPSPSQSGQLIPRKRPDNGGRSSFKTSNLVVNHFPVKYDSNFVILHYDIDIKQNIPSGLSSTLTKSENLLVKQQLFWNERTRFPESAIADDGEKNLYSALPLPEETFEVSIFRGEEARPPRMYKVTVKLVKQLELSRLQAYFESSHLPVPQEILQGMEVIMKENPRRNRIPIGRCFYPKRIYENLGQGIMASRGLQQSLKPTSQGLALCVDYSVNTFLKPIPVLEYIKERLDISIHKGTSWNEKEQKDVESVLKRLRVTVNHRMTNQKYVVVGLTKDSAKEIRFKVNDSNDPNTKREIERKIVEYFNEKYKKDVEYKNLPCLDLSKNNRTNYVPMEFCELVGGQRYPRENLDRLQSRSLKELAVAPPGERKRRICEMVEASDGPCRGSIINQFNITVDTQMTKVMGRVLKQPVLKLHNQTLTPPDGRCQWNLVNKKVTEGKKIARWAILDFSSGVGNPHSRDAWNVNKFIFQFVERCTGLGINMEPTPLFIEKSTIKVLSKDNELETLLNDIYQRVHGSLNILLCAMAGINNGYKSLKRICETKIGIVTQCFLTSNASKDRNDQFLANLAIKINAKVGGTTVELHERLPRLDDHCHCMFMGADVNHPTVRDLACPSIAAVTATINWPAANKYRVRYCAQIHRMEKIQNIGEMCLDLIKTYERINGVKPEKIILFRDGVSESQFDMVLNEELSDIRRAFSSDRYSPTITLIIARKRHQTRLFLDDGNVHPGTVVDTIIVHPEEYDFYLCSHHGSLGTSKPTHYQVLWDDHGFTSDELQRIIYNLCYTFARCTKPVSLVPPVYYADLAAYRARLYYESLQDSSSPYSNASSVWSKSPSSSAASPGSSSPSLDPTDFLKLQSDVENSMFFC